jgi:23S rRNA (adenine2503-C2)-methyltransferase
MKLIESHPDAAGATKFVWDTGEGRATEATAFLANAPNEFGAIPGVVCLSSQVGCNVGCRFCASGRQRRLRNLTTTEMVEQAIIGRKALATSNVSVTFSGIGEPTQNLSAVTDAADLLCDSHDFTYASISTVGIPTAIDRLIKRRPSTRLYISLHATTDSVREALIPSPSRFPIADVIAAGARYAEATARRTRMSYLLLEGVNDSTDDIDRLAQMLHPELFEVQLLLWNAVPGLPFKRVPTSAAESFAEQVSAKGLHAYVSVSKAQKVGGACGQLAGLVSETLASPVS